MPSADAPRSGARLAPLLLLFFLSGASALVYQVLWMRLLALVFGVTVHAASTVLAAFMTGLAIGSAAAGRLSDRVARPLGMFAVAEALVAVAALLTPFGLGAVESLYVRLHPALANWPLLIAFLRFALSFAVLVVPATLMGATLPLVVKSAVARGAILGRQVSLLYAFNTAGAVAGTLVAGIWMVPQLGISWAFRVGAIVNLIVAAGALLLSRLSTFGADATAPAPASAESRPATDDGRVATSTAPSSPFVQRLVLITFGVSGFVSFALEIIWFRMLVILFRPTTYAFTLMLSTVLAGIAIGSALSTFLTSRRRLNPIATLATLEVLLALAALLSMTTIGDANRVYMWAGPVFMGGPLSYFGPMIVTSIVAIFPASLLMGMAFPLGLAIWTSHVDDHHAGARIGVIYAVNVAGAVAGSLLTGFLLLPTIGSRASLLLVSTMTLGMGLLLLTPLPRRRAAIAAGTIAAAAFAGIAAAAPDPVARLLRSRYPRDTQVWRQEDGHATVTILRHDRSVAVPTHGLYINGMHQASDTPQMVNYHKLIGTLPVAVHPEPRRALVIGSGGGATAGAVAAFSNDTIVDVVELSPAVVDAARQFSAINQGLFTRPNVRLRIDDGRNYMLLTPEKYDLVTADVILPVHAGAGNLYSVEYYRLMRRVLNNRGIALQWIGSTGDTEYKLIMRTFFTVFPHTTLWHGGSLMVGSTRPLVLDEESFLRKQAAPQSKAALDSMGFESFDNLLSRYTAGPAEIRTFLGDGRLLTDDQPLTEYFLSLPQNDAAVDLSKMHGNVMRHVIRARRLEGANRHAASSVFPPRTGIAQ
jgi:spermidine synthase